MARPKTKAPARRSHLSGQSVVTINQRDYYLGPHDSAEAIARYAVLMSVYQAGGLSLPDDFDLRSLDERVGVIVGAVSPMTMAQDQTSRPILVRHVTAAFREHAKARYANSHAELTRLNQVCDELDAHDGDTEAAKFGPVALQAHRKRWIEHGYARKYCNRLTNIVVRIFKYSVSQELIEETTHSRLKSVEPLREGQTTAHENDEVTPANLDDVRKTAEELSPVLKAMVRIHVCTGMRPSEICRMRPCDIDRSGSEWIYRPAKHKTKSKGKVKAVPIIGDARDALTDYMNRDADAYCFSPRESMAWFRAKQRAKRKTKVQPSQKNRRTSTPKKQPGVKYTPGSYGQAIKRAAKRAKVDHWHPYQLRHLAGTVIREALGVEAAQAVLGHSRASMTEHYAKQSETKAIEAAKVAPKL